MFLLGFLKCWSGCDLEEISENMAIYRKFTQTVLAATEHYLQGKKNVYIFQ